MLIADNCVGDARDLLARSVKAEREIIVDECVRMLEIRSGPLVREHDGRDYLRYHAGNTVDEVVAHLRGCPTTGDGMDHACVEGIGRRPASGGDPLVDCVEAAEVVSTAVLAALSRHVPDGGGAIVLDAMHVVHVSLVRWVGAVGTGYTSYLLDRVAQGHTDERRRIARDLHDRVAQSLTASQRQFDLHELRRFDDPERAGEHLAFARELLLGAICTLRAVTSDMRWRDPVNCLEQSLRRFLTTLADDGVRIDLRCTGETGRLGPAVRDESFLIIREAISNGLAHGLPSRVTVQIEIGGTDFRARIEDDGCGFDPEEIAYGCGGMPSMHERAATIGGSLSVTVDPGSRTCVELVVPHPEESHDVAAAHHHRRPHRRSRRRSRGAR